MKRPNFFIVGAPKCGTTALYTYLRRNPDIFLPHKEIHHFGSDLRFRYTRRSSISSYLDLFAQAGSESALGDVSVWYLFSKTAAQEIHEFDPGARIIAMLRNPVDMMYSLHSQFLYAGDEDLTSFAEALKAGAERRQGKRIPRGARLPQALVYRDVARYKVQVERYLETFGRSRVRVILLEEMKRETAAVHSSILEFLGVDPDHRNDFAVVNPNTLRRNRWLAQQMAVPNPGVRRFVRLVLPDRTWRRKLGRAISQVNTVRQPRPPLNDDLRRQLMEEFGAEIEELETLIRRDLAAWRRPAPA